MPSLAAAQLHLLHCCYQVPRIWWVRHGSRWAVVLSLFLERDKQNLSQWFIMELVITIYIFLGHQREPCTSWISYLIFMSCNISLAICFQKFKINNAILKEVEVVSYSDPYSSSHLNWFICFLSCLCTVWLCELQGIPVTCWIFHWIQNCLKAEER